MKSTTISEVFNAALVAEDLLWSSSMDVAGVGQTVMVDAANPAADPDARNRVYLDSMVCAMDQHGVTAEVLAAAVRAKFDGDGTDLLAILNS